MRKYLYAGAVAGGFLLLAATPAHADEIPAPATAQQGGGSGLGLLGPDGNLGLDDPLGGDGKVLSVVPGTNSADVHGASGSVLPDVDGLPAARTGLGKPGDRRPAAQAAKFARPAAGVTEGVLPGGGDGRLPTGGLGGLPVADLLGGGLLGGLLPDGRMPAMTADQESGLLGDSLPLLGGLLPVSSARTLPAFSGMPAGGTAVPAASTGDTPRATPAKAADRPAARPAADPATVNDARLHEEPIDPEGKGDRTDARPFSDGRPVAGVDPDFK